MDEKFERVNEKLMETRLDIAGGLAGIKQEFAEQNRQAEERQKGTRRFWISCLIALIAAAADVLSLILR